MYQRHASRVDVRPVDASTVEVEAPSTACFGQALMNHASAPAAAAEVEVVRWTAVRRRTPADVDDGNFGESMSLLCLHRLPGTTPMYRRCRPSSRSAASAATALALRLTALTLTTLILGAALSSVSVTASAFQPPKPLRTRRVGGGEDNRVTAESIRQLTQLKDSFRDLQLELDKTVLAPESENSIGGGGAGHRRRTPSTLDYQSSSEFDGDHGGHQSSRVVWMETDGDEGSPPLFTQASTQRLHHRMRHGGRRRHKKTQLHASSASPSAHRTGGNRRPEVLPSWEQNFARSVKAGITTTVDRRHRPATDDENNDRRLQSQASVQSLQDEYNRNSGRARQQAPGGNSFLSRQQRVCPTLSDGKERLLCPSKNRGRYHVCINVDQLCNEREDCPEGEDEAQTNCLFYRTTMGHFKKVVDAVVALTDHMVRTEERHLEL